MTMIPHLDSLLISGVRMVPRYLVDELRKEVLGRAGRRELDHDR